MKRLRGLVTPVFVQRELDERAHHIDLLALRDAFVAVMLLVAALPLVGLIPILRFQNVIAWDLFPALAIVTACLVLLVSRTLRGGQQWPYVYRTGVGLMLSIPGTAVIFLVMHMITGDKPPLSFFPLYIVFTLIVAAVLLLLARRQVKNEDGEPS